MKYIVTLNGKNYEVDVTETEAAITSVSAAPAVPVQAAPAVSSPAAPAAPAVPDTAAQTSGGEQVKSPMPGNILSVNVSLGQHVKAGDVMFILEAMKMENEIVAPVDGTVKRLFVSKGSVVETDVVLAVI